jgi:hypothetical protein
MLGFGRRAARRDREIEGVIKEISEGELRRRPLAWFKLSEEDSARLSPSELEFYDLFSWFAPALEFRVGAEWTIDATDRVYVDGGDMPVFGRHFVVYFNRQRVGQIEVHPTYRDPGAWVSVRLRHLHHVPYALAFQFLTAVEEYVGPWESVEASRPRAESAAAARLSGYLWEVIRTDGLADALLEFEHMTNGPCTLFHDCVAHWRHGGMTPEKLVRGRYEAER